MSTLEETESPAAALRPMPAARYIGVGKTTLWRFVKEDADFPQPIHVTPKLVLFRVDALDAWLAAVAARNVAAKKKLLRDAQA
ncbi:helix-turn-helix transcriptional regulator [Paraburkholderia sp. EG286B]|uniref:helix-turn-helix transcriptional regulator n=1 Tax=Paraburkholderia sp. EG286B TaxID=3237011 RepID=UPI0034D1766B